MMRPQVLVKYGIEVRAMATDYDTPRKTDEELHEESLEELKAKRVDAQSGQIDVDEAEAAETGPMAALVTAVPGRDRIPLARGTAELRR